MRAKRTGQWGQEVLRVAALSLSVGLLVTAAAAQSFSTLEECIASYAKEFNLTQSDAKAKCDALFVSPSPSPSFSPLPSPSFSPFPLHSPSPVEVCIQVTMKEKGLAYDEAKWLCTGPPEGQMGGVAAAVAATASDCVARVQKEKGVGEEEARKACAAMVTAASSFEHCVAAAVEKGLSKEEAYKSCSAQTPAEQRRPMPRMALREVAEKLREKVQAKVPGPIQNCLKEAQGLMEACVEKGKAAGECRAEVVREMKESCAITPFEGTRGSVCMAKCGEEREACLASKSEETCNKEGLACLSQCPEAVGKLATLAMKMGKFRGLRIDPLETKAVDEDQKPVEVGEGTIEVRKVEATAPIPAAEGSGASGEAGARRPTSGPRPLLTLILPVKLAAGKKLASFQHEASGIALEHEELSIPMKSGAEVAARIKAKIREAVGRGNAAEAVVERLQMETKAYEVDLSDRKPLVGKVLAKLAADLKDLPENAEIKVTPLAALAEEKKKGIEEEAKRRGLTVKEVAYSMEVEHKNLGSTVEKANVTMTVSRAWVDSRGGPGSVRIFREGDDGSKQVLETAFLGYDGDNAIFEGRSPGLSVFSLVAVEEEGRAAPAQPAPSSPPYGLIGLVAAVGIGVAVALGLARKPRGEG